jgi:hypothetical protein
MRPLNDMGAMDSFNPKKKTMAHYTEYSASNAWNQNFNATNGNLNNNNKATNTNQVRPVSAQHKEARNRRIFKTTEQQQRWLT